MPERQNLHLGLGIRIGLVAVSIGYAAGTFLLLGTVAALWKNPRFIRMMPPTGFEIVLLLAQSVLVGAYMATPAPACSSRAAGIGNVLSFLGIACPICNKMLVLTLGPALLMQYFEPIRLYVGLIGIGIIAYALWRRIGGMQVGVSSALAGDRRQLITGP